MQNPDAIIAVAIVCCCSTSILFLGFILAMCRAAAKGDAMLEAARRRSEWIKRQEEEHAKQTSS